MWFSDMLHEVIVGSIAIITEGGIGMPFFWIHGVNIFVFASARGVEYLCDKAFNVQTK